MAHRIAAISGSLREGSYNTAMLHAMKALAPGTLEIDVLTIDGVEPFNEDVEAEGWPPGVTRLRQQVEPTDGVILASPEYNYSLSGVMKNAIDWLSRPTGEGPIVGKPVLIAGASMSSVGTARAQGHLRSIAFYNAMPVCPTAEILLGGAQEKFDDNGRLTDGETRKFISGALEDFADWVGRFV